MKRILGYTTPWSAEPGGTVSVHVHTFAPEPYKLDIVRVVSGDADALGLDLRPVASPIDGQYEGSPQRTPLGSSVVVEFPPLPGPRDSLSIEFWVWPTTPQRGRQGLVSHWVDVGMRGYSVEIDEHGHLNFRVAGDRIVGTVALPERRWTHVIARFDPATASLSLRQATSADAVTGTGQTVEASARAELRLTVLPDLPLLIGAVADGVHRAHHFNGKLAQVSLSINDALAASWNFQSGDAGAEVSDHVGGHHGRLVNLPALAVTGPSWTGDIHDWRAAPDQYDAIHFHEDDLYDARWNVAHTLNIPDDWTSGYHAIRLRAGDDISYLPLLVRPRRGEHGAPLAFLVSTLTTIAYANYHFHLHVATNEVSLGRATVLSPEDVLLCEGDQLGLSTYDLHIDGSPVRYSSRLRPVINNWPGGEVWNLNADTHILAWLDHIGQPYDVITDEDLHAEGIELLRGYRAVMTGSHPEYWTTPMWDGLSGYLGSGGRLLYFGGNGFYWRTSMSAAWPGAIEVRRAESGGRYTAEEPGNYYTAFTGELGGLWRRSGRPPNALVGVGTRGIGFDGIGRFRRTAASHGARVDWLFAGVAGEIFGEKGLVGCAAASEVDATDLALGTPRHSLVVAVSEGHTDSLQPMPEDILMPHPAMGAHHNRAVRAEMTFFETANGGAVLSVGSLSWGGAVAIDGFSSDVAQISRNALARFLDPQPFLAPGDS